MYNVGRKIFLNEGQAAAKTQKNCYKTLLVPVATIGCGKHSTNTFFFDSFIHYMNYLN